MSQEITEPAIEPSLDTYRFYDREWDGYDELREAFEWEVPERFNMVTYLCDRWADAEPDRLAMTAVGTDDTDTEHAYGQLHGTANRLANYLADRGIEAGDRVAVSGAQKVEFLAVHAAWKLGAVSVPLSILFGPEGLGYRLADSGASAFVADGAALPALREVEADSEVLGTVLVVGNAPTEFDETAFRGAIDGRSTEFETSNTDAEEPATIVYTSGTTGSPKGAVQPHRSLLGVLPSHVLQARNMEIRADDLVYSPAEWSWMGPLYQGVLASLYYGTPVLGDAAQFDPERTLELIDRYDISFMGARRPSTG